MVLASLAAWSRALAVLFLTLPVAHVAAHEDKLFTSSVTYCAEPRALLIQQFNVQYVRANNSIIFDIQAASVEDNLNVNGNLMLTVYGMNSLNVSIDLCSIANGALCPLPTYNFNGSAVIPLDFYSNLFDVSQHVPTIAYIVPDIEAFAQLTLTRVEDGEVVACVQSTLSNGWSLHQPPATWATAVIAIIALLAALFQSRFQASRPVTTASSPSYATTRFIDLMQFFQHICITGLVSINYPLAYRQFVLNFAWAFGLIRISSIQHAIDNLRHHTGGKLPDGSLDAVDYTNRKLSPYNIPAGAGSVNLAVPAVVTRQQENALPPGIPTFVNSLGISNQNAFLTLFFTLLLCICAAIAFFGIIYGCLLLVERLRKERTPEWVVRFRGDFPQVLKAHAVLLAFFCLLPVMTLAFFQWSFKDSWFAVLVSVLVFLAVLVGAVYPLGRTFMASRRVGADALQSQPELAFALPLFAQFRAPRWSFMDTTIVSFFVKALVLVCGRPHGLFQVIFLLVLEALALLALCFVRPHKSRGGDAFAIFLAVVRLVTVALLIPFAQHLNIKPIPRAALGMGSAVVSSATVVVLFFSILINALWGTFRVPNPLRAWRERRVQTPRSSGSATAAGDADNDSWAQGKPWSPTASAKAYMSDLPPRPGPPELESRFATPARDFGPRASGYTVSSLPSDILWPPSSPGHPPPSSPSSYGRPLSGTAGYGFASAPPTPSASSSAFHSPPTPSAASSAFHSAATHPRLDSVSEHSGDLDGIREHRRSSDTSVSSRTERERQR
ncbi:TRP-domain-containing protein [Auricularia subglabra TFB-10046 SS5]|uniref:TRP-domain-containing protein n=1 Tax=Auricularia subglabra (strain TFB-10046 / SS5) TaxID=717982 RepID=J0WVC8_AURST|nr:TRP-domain-containing protein [Auricularia subglabra TFB-10046 SS5]